MVGARAFGYFALLKVTRRKAATLSGCYGSNGYTPKNIEVDGLRRFIAVAHRTDRSPRSSSAARAAGDLSQHGIGEKHEVQQVQAKVRGNRCT